MKPPFHSSVFRLAIAVLLFAITPACSKRAGASSPSRAATPSNRSNGKGDEMKGMQGMGNMPGMPGMQGTEMKGAEEKASEFVVPVERQQQIGVSFAAVEMKPLSHSIRAVGRVVPETQRIWRVVSRTTAYVQELGVNAPGELVKKNQVLMKLYSPELLTTQRELIDLLRSRDGTAKNTHSARGDFQRLIESAERRLRLWNVTDEQIAKIEQTRQAEESLPILSKVDGRWLISPWCGFGASFIRTNYRCFKSARR
jgi:Barrel-sandwich domain of CusB or HlyD membrane-fusion